MDRNLSTCVLCQNHATRLFDSNGLSINKCWSCGLRFVSGTSNSLELYQGTWAENFFEAERSVPQGHVENARLLRRLCGKERATLLDVGCGAGDFLAVAREEGFEVTGLDPSLPAARMAMKDHDIKVTTMSIEEFDGAFDVVTSFGVLEHVTDPKSFLFHSVRLLKPGGLLWVYTPVWGLYDHVAALLARTNWTRLIDRRINECHLQIFPRPTLVSLLKELGLKDVQAATLCEYHLPVGSYLADIGFNHTGIQRAVDALIKRGLFFRNNMRVLGLKP